MRSACVVSGCSYFVGGSELSCSHADFQCLQDTFLQQPSWHSMLQRSQYSMASTEGLATIVSIDKLMPSQRPTHILQHCTSLVCFVDTFQTSTVACIDLKDCYHPVASKQTCTRLSHKHGDVSHALRVKRKQPVLAGQSSSVLWR